VPELRAGHLTGRLAGAGLRDVRVAGRRALDALSVTVRDAGWRTVPGEVMTSRTATTAEGTCTELEVRHCLGGVRFRWRGTIETSPGLIRFAMDGVAECDFDANRIGFVMLHPQALKGRPLRAGGPGGEFSAEFPGRISPHELATGVTWMTYGVGGGAELDVRLDGDLFEIEDHRNWSDPGWKTYCTPLSAPRPVRHQAGQRTRQSVELRARGTRAGAGGQRAGGAARVVIGTASAGTVPSLGLGASCLPSVSAAGRDAVRDLRPAYLHVELEDGGPWQDRLEAALAEAAGLGVPLDIALVVPAGRVTAMARCLAVRLARHVGAIGRVSVFGPARHTTEPGTVAEVRAALGGAGCPVRFGGGSRAHLAELNRGRFDLDSWDFVTYGLTPQVHHDDDRSVLETEAAVADGLAQAGAIAAGLPVVTGPVTLRPRFNAAAERADPLPPADGDGPDVDERQHAPLAAVYLAAAVSRLAGASAVTLYRSVGRRGVIRADGVPAPAARVIAALSPLAGSAVRQTAAPDSLCGLAAVTPAGLFVLVANLTQANVPLELAGVMAVTEAAVLGGGELDPHRMVLPGYSVAAISAVGA
jgi:D-apionolactonase